MAQKGSKTWLRAQANKKMIYESAMSLFAAHGYDNVSIDDIVRKANSSKGSFYNYFRSKDELFVFYNQALEESFGDFYDKLLADKHYGGQSGLEKIYIMVMYMLHRLQQSRREFITVADMRQLRGENGKAAEEDVLRKCLDRHFPALLELGKKDGSIRKNLDNRQALQLLYTYLKGIVFEWESSGHPGDVVNDAAFIIDFFCRSLATTLTDNTRI